MKAMINLLKNFFTSKDAEIPWIHCASYVDSIYHPEYFKRTGARIELVPECHGFYLVMVYRRTLSNGKINIRESKIELDFEEYQAYSKKIPDTLMPISI
jgi:predicted metal-dependent phosphoesterase TrpH